MTRREAREQALCFVFERMFKEEDSISEIVTLAEKTRDLEPDDFAVALAKGTFNHIDEIDEIIKQFSIRWSNERLSKIVRSILRMAIYEIYYIKNVPVNVTINEAVELAKKYGGDGDSAFVNGLLGKLSRSDDFKNDERIKAKEDLDSKNNKVK